MYTAMKYLFLILICLVSGCGKTNPPNNELVLIEGGSARVPIIVGENASPFNRQAAEELADYLEKTGGARPEVLLTLPDPLPESAIWVGYQPALKTLFPQTDFEFQHPEEILIESNGKHLVLAGRDKWKPEVAALTEYPENLVLGVQQEYGTANAVYTFLQDHLGVRWIWPGEIGEVIAPQDRIAIAPISFRYHPQIRSRSGILTYSRLGGKMHYGKSQDWARRQRVQLDSLTVGGGHGFSDWWERFHETNPDFFALQPDGTRSGYPSPKYAKLCESNPAVWDQWMKEVGAQLEERPDQTVFNASANDGWTSGHCVCENCLAWDHPEGELRKFSWKGLNQEAVSLSDRQVTFANVLAKKLKERYPDKEYFVLISAYGHSRPAPLKAVPDENVIISSVANFLTRPNLPDEASPQGTLHRDQFSAWGKVAPNLFWRPNQARLMTAKPNIPISQTIEDIRFVADNQSIGIFVDTVWENWATRGPLYYILSQMAWNPQQDGAALMEDYYNRGFGKAAGDMKEYWTYMEEKWEQSQERVLTSLELFDEEFFKKAYGILEQADASLKGEPEIYKKRVQFVRVGLDYTRLINESYALMNKFKESGGKDTEAEDAARKIWLEEIHPMVTDQANLYAINWGPTRPGAGHRKKSPENYPKGLPEPREW